MHIEFVGLPGAGKSTIARIVSARLSAAGHRTLDSPVFAKLGRGADQGVLSRWRHALSDARHSVVPSWDFRRLLIRIAGDPERRHLVSRYWRLMRIRAALERLQAAGGDSAMAVFDQGILQCLGSVYPSSLLPEEVYTLTHATLQAVGDLAPDLTVFVNIDAETAERRIRARPYQRITIDLARTDVMEQMEPHRRYVEQTLPRVLKALGARTLSVSGADAAEKNAERIMDEIAAAGTAPVARTGEARP